MPLVELAVEDAADIEDVVAVGGPAAEAVGTVAELQDNADAAMVVLGSVDFVLPVLEAGMEVHVGHNVMCRVDPGA